MRRREFVTAGLGASAFTGALAARAQQRAKAHRMAVAHPSAATSDLTQGKEARMFFEELRKRGYVEGQNLTVELYSGRGQTERYAQLAAEVVSRNPDVILTFTSGCCGISRRRRPRSRLSERRPILWCLGWCPAWHGRAAT